MRRSLFLFVQMGLIVAGILAFHSTAWAQTLDYATTSYTYASLSTATPINLGSGTQDWIMFLYPGDITVKTGGTFNPFLTLDDGTTTQKGYNGTGAATDGIPVAYAGSQYFFGTTLNSTPLPTPNTTGTDAVTGNVKRYAYNTTGLSSMLVMAASTETLTFYLDNYKTTSNFTFTLGGSTYTEPNVLALGFDPTNAQQGRGAFTVTITGATAGEILTWDDRVATAGGSVGLTAITATYAVPEPPEVALALAGVILLWGYSARRWGRQSA